MVEALKSIAFVVVTVMVALILQAHAGNLSTDQLDTADNSTLEQIQVYN